MPWQWRTLSCSPNASYGYLEEKLTGDWYVVSSDLPSASGSQKQELAVTSPAPFFCMIIQTVDVHWPIYKKIATDRIELASDSSRHSLRMLFTSSPLNLGCDKSRLIDGFAGEFLHSHRLPARLLLPPQPPFFRSA
ncbi:uncharacterized protein LOC112346280 [Selaginella moellendorffii]|uniref:uncharacterized protein LOC112346280 n=1 Tax=Selaginella moellendorffii TaxID=88036 RepID=UPI000D1CE879|nr:uncharacterized protein LOC112346280 [Selaginella moellendorffii]|eukprot:XP_024530653.1 uncharacterized protein LOC112346280 [Selaginella moellendorffii]